MFPDQFKYFNIDNLEDQEDHDATEHFASVKNFTDDALHKGGAVCFHCAAGISRSA
jgi:protein-tyrosine phosphatase